MPSLHVEDFAGPQRRVANGTEMWVRNCPVCKSSSWKVYVNLEKGVWHCHAALHGKGGRVAGVFSRQLPKPPASFPPIDLPEWSPLGAKASEYLSLRGISPSVAAKLALVEAQDDKLLGRILVPYFAGDGRCIWWTARSYSKHLAPKPKYIGAPVDRPLYMVRSLVPDGPLDQHAWVIVEGPFDAIAAALAGVNAISVGGTRMTNRQRRQLFSLTPRDIIVMLDGDASAKAVTLARQLRHIAPTRFVTLSPGQDPGNMAKEDLCRTLCLV
jgi:hypothetical protein